MENWNARSRKTKSLFLSKLLSSSDLLLATFRQCSTGHGRSSSSLVVGLEGLPGHAYRANPLTTCSEGLINARRRWKWDSLADIGAADPDRWWVKGLRDRGLYRERGGNLRALERRWGPAIAFWSDVIEAGMLGEASRGLQSYACLHYPFPLLFVIVRVCVRAAELPKAFKFPCLEYSFWPQRDPAVERNGCKLFPFWFCSSLHHTFEYFRQRTLHRTKTTCWPISRRVSWFSSF
jgi:hypothetical protein